MWRICQGLKCDASAWVESHFDHITIMSVVQLETIVENPRDAGAPQTASSRSGRTLGSEPAIDDGNAPSTAVSALERWNYPRHNILRLMATFWSFVVSGANDAAYGVCTPYLEDFDLESGC